MATTPHGIPLADENTVVNPITVPLNAMASALDGALDDIGKPGSYAGTNAERLALAAPDLRNGITFYTTDTRLLYLRDAGNWKVIGGRPIICRLTTSISQGWSTTPVAFQWGGTPTHPIIDTDGMWSAAQNTRITIKHTGIYRVAYNLRSSGIIAATAYVRRNGSSSSSDLTAGASVGSSGAGTNPQGDAYLELTVGDYLEVVHNSPSTGIGSWNQPSCSFSVEFKGQK